MIETIHFVILVHFLKYEKNYIHWIPINDISEYIHLEFISRQMHCTQNHLFHDKFFQMSHWSVSNKYDFFSYFKYSTNSIKWTVPVIVVNPRLTRKLKLDKIGWKLKVTTPESTRSFWVLGGPSHPKVQILERVVGWGRERINLNNPKHV